MKKIGSTMHGCTVRNTQPQSERKPLETPFTKGSLSGLEDKYYATTMDLVFVLGNR